MPLSGWPAHSGWCLESSGWARSPWPSPCWTTCPDSVSLRRARSLPGHGEWRSDLLDRLRLAAVRAALTVIRTCVPQDTSIRWVRTASTPVGYDRCMQLTIPFSKLSTPRLGSLRRASHCAVETAGFTPDGRFGELSSTSGVSSRPLRLERTSDTSSPRGHSLEHRMQPRRTRTRCPAIGPLRGDKMPRSLGSNPLV